MSSDRGRPHEHIGEGHYTPREAAEMLGVTEETVRNMIRDKRLLGFHYRNEANEPRWAAEKESVHMEAERRGRPPVVADIEHALVAESEQRVKEIVEAARQLLAESDQRMLSRFVAEIEENRGVMRQVAASLISAIDSQQNSIQRIFDASNEHISSVFVPVIEEVRRAIGDQKRTIGEKMDTLSKEVSELSEARNRTVDVLEEMAQREKENQERALRLQEEVRDVLIETREAQREIEAERMKQQHSFWRWFLVALFFIVLVANGVGIYLLHFG
jgi:DNA repair exonuclease SbcCD ATPase subunit